MTCPIIDWLRLKWAVRDNQSWVSRFSLFFCFSPSPIKIPSKTLHSTQRICLLLLKNTGRFNYRISGVGLTVCTYEDNQSQMAVRKSSAAWANIYWTLSHTLRVKTLVQLLFYIFFFFLVLTCAGSSWLMNMAPTCLILAHLIRLFHMYASGTEMNFILKLYLQR